LDFEIPNSEFAIRNHRNPFDVRPAVVNMAKISLASCKRVPTSWRLPIPATVINSSQYTVSDSLLLRNRQLVDEIGLRLGPVRFSVIGPDASAGFKQLPAQGFTQIVFWKTLQKPDQNEGELFRPPFQLNFVHCFTLNSKF